jgi:hypothetical protein
MLNEATRHKHMRGSGVKLHAVLSSGRAGVSLNAAPSDMKFFPLLSLKRKNFLENSSQLITRNYQRDENRHWCPNS